MSQPLETLVSPQVRSVSKSNVVSPQSSPGNLVPGSPPQTGMSAAEEDQDSRELSDSATSPPPLTESLPANLGSGQPSQPTVYRSASHSLQRAESQSSHRASPPAAPQRRASFGLSFLSSLSNTIRGNQTTGAPTSPFAEPHAFMSNSPTIANLNHFANDTTITEQPMSTNLPLTEAVAGDSAPPVFAAPNSSGLIPRITRENTSVEVSDITRIVETEDVEAEPSDDAKEAGGKDKDGLYSVRLTPIIDHSASNTGLYFSPVIRRIEPKSLISIGRYTEKNKSAAHAPQGSLAPVVFKSKVVSRTHAMFQCNEDGLWFLKDCKSSSGTFLNNIRLSQASQELTLWPLIDGDIVQLGLDYRGGTEEVYRCVKMRCEFNRSWQRKVNRFNLDIHKKMKNLGLETKNEKGEDEFSECAICLLKLEPCQALFISPCSHSWHYKCIRPIIIKSYPQFYCPNCRSMCDLETDIEDED